MKTTTSVLAIIGLFSIALAQVRAQDAATRPLQIPPPSPEGDILPTPIPTTTPAAQEKKSTPKATPTSTPEKTEPKTEDEAAPVEKTTEKTRESAHASPAPNPPEKVAKKNEKPARKRERRTVSERAERGGNAASQLKEMEKEWEAAFTDPAVIEKYVADDFVGTSTDGRVVSKKSLLREAKDDKGAPPKTAAHSLDVHFYGSDIAVVVGGAKQTDRNKAGDIVRRDYRFTDTWVLRDGKWQCVASQSLLLPRR